MVAGSYTELPQNIIPLEKQKVSIVKSAAILGANASGKSNFIKCANFAKFLITDDNYLFFHNKNKQINKNKPTTYCFGILIEGNQFEYSFSLNKDRIIEEKLIEYITQKPTQHFYRKYNFETKNYEWSQFSKSLKENKVVLNEIKKVLPEKSLFLNRVAQFEIQLFKDIFYFFKKFLILDKYVLDKVENHMKQIIFQKIKKEPEFKYNIIKELKRADFMIEKIDVFEDEKQNLELISFHNSIKEDGDIVEEIYDFELNESIGTQKFLLLFSLLIMTINTKGILMVDEFDNSLHTHLSQHLLSMVHDLTTNTNNVQLIFTIHDTNLINQKLLRRDQIWFAERDSIGNSKIIPLSDYKVKKGKDLENSYLQGVYGAIPNIEK
ncbi:MAG: ATP-binding protein [Leptospiraceae bacterium]|nr:ATP-binding protein [Leptospiraceae bacterium]